MSSKSASLTEKTGVVVFSRIITTVIDLVVAVAIVNLLSKTDFAVLGYMLMVHELARNFATLGFPESVFYYFERVSGGARKGFVLQTIAILLATGLITALLIIGLSYVVPSLLTQWEGDAVSAVQKYLPFIAFVALFEIPTWPTTNILLASDNQRGAAWYEMLTSLLLFGCLVIPLALGYPLQVAVFGLMVYSIVRFLGSIVAINLILPEQAIQREITIREQSYFSIPLGISSYVNKINRYIDKFVVSILLTGTAYAEYTVGAQEVPIIRVIPLAVGSVLISKYVNFQLDSKKEELLQLWYKGIKKVSLIVVPLTILSIVVASDFISLLFEKGETSYQAAVLPFQIYNLMLLIRVTHYGGILQAFGDTKGVLYLSINLLVANAILSVPLTMWLGITGTALSTVIAFYYNGYLMLSRIGGHLEIPAWRVLPLGPYSKILGIAVLVGVVVWWARVSFIGEESVVAGLSAAIVAYMMLFLIVGTLTKVIEREDWNTLLNWLKFDFLFK